MPQCNNLNKKSFKVEQVWSEKLAWFNKDTKQGIKLMITITKCVLMTYSTFILYYGLQIKLA